MNDLISRQATLSDLRALPVDLDAKTVQRCIEVVSNEKSAQPEQQGHWVYGEDEDGVDGYYCNKCGFFVTWDYKHSHIHFIDDYLFCPHCKARMTR